MFGARAAQKSRWAVYLRFSFSTSTDLQGKEYNSHNAFIGSVSIIHAKPCISSSCVNYRSIHQANPYSKMSICGQANPYSKMSICGQYSYGPSPHFIGTIATFQDRYVSAALEQRKEFTPREDFIGFSGCVMTVLMMCPFLLKLVSPTPLGRGFFWYKVGVGVIGLCCATTLSMMHSPKRLQEKPTRRHSI